jgi:hypothetical protein
MALLFSRQAIYIVKFPYTVNDVPAQPFEKVDNFETSTDKVLATNFWHTPYPANRMLFSATFATNDGRVPAYKPRTIPSFLNVSLRHIHKKI